MGQDFEEMWQKFRKGASIEAGDAILTPHPSINQFVVSIRNGQSKHYLMYGTGDMLDAKVYPLNKSSFERVLQKHEGCDKKVHETHLFNVGVAPDDNPTDQNVEDEKSSWQPFLIIGVIVIVTAILILLALM